MKTVRIILSSIMVFVMCIGFASCDNRQNTDETSAVITTVAYTYYPDEQPVGYYKRCGISADAETIEQLRELNELAKKGYLVLKDDWTAYFELDGEITEYTYDRGNLYLKDDTEKLNGFSYVHINGRLVVNYGTTVEQYMILTDEELADYLENGAETSAE